MKRVSQLFALRKKNQVNQVPPTAKLAPILVDPPASRWVPSSDDEDSFTETDGDSIYDIRCPSGLGRSASFSSGTSVYSMPSTRNEEPLFYVSQQRSQDMSSSIPTTTMEPTRNSICVGDQFSQNSSRHLPNEVILGILKFLPRPVVAHLATVSTEFCINARVVLYEQLNISRLRDKQIEGLVTLLAYRRDLADLVRTFECRTWPTFFTSQDSGVFPASPIRSSFSPTLSAAFTIAFQNMHQITSLTLPSFDPVFLRHHSAFMLKRITFLCPTMTSVEKARLFTWLDGQTNVTHLLFPNLMDESAIVSHSNLHLDVPINSAQIQTETPECSPTSNILLFPLPPDTPPIAMTPSPSKLSWPQTASSSSTLFPMPDTPPESEVFSSSKLLPALTTISATPSMITLLLCSGHSLASSPPTRPLCDVTLNINKSLYTGLRPSSFMNALRTQHIQRLVLRFGSAVDRRTVGKVLSSATVLFAASKPAVSEQFLGVALDKTPQQWDNEDENKVEKQTLTELEIELDGPVDGKDLIVYKALNSVLPRYQGLVHLRLRFSTKPEHSPSFPLAPERHGGTHSWMQICPSLCSVTRFSGRTWKRT